MRRLSQLVLLAAALCLVSAAQQASAPAAPAPSVRRQPLPRGQALPLAKQYATDFLQGRGASLWDHMTDAMRAGVGNDRAAFEQYAAGIPDQVGRVAETLQERIMPALDQQVYSKLIRAETSDEKLVLTIVLDPDGQIAALGLGPLPKPSPTEYGDYKDKTSFAFPLKGTWTIYQGGRSVYDSYYAESYDRRFAYDITRLQNGSMYANDGAKLTDFYAYAQPVFAAAAGKVIYVQDRYDDNPVNGQNEGVARQGNSIILDHGNGEFSFYGNLRHGSIKVRSGQAVASGQQIAEVGNSGDSPIPHLHFHVQDSPVWFNGNGLPISFQKVVVNEVRLGSASPVRGDEVQPQ